MTNDGRPVECASLLRGDLDDILRLTSGWEELRGQRLFVTGGTGFFGTWLLHSLAWANAQLGLGASVLVLTRDAAAFRARVPDLADNPAIAFHAGDVASFAFPDGAFSHVIHAATTSAVATFHNEDPLRKFDTVIEGTRRTLEFAVRSGARKFLLTSSGAVYGKQSPDVAHIAEDCTAAPNTLDPGTALGQGKRAAEFLCAYYSGRFGIQTKIARCFSFLGPYLQLNIHYAAGNFVRNVLRREPIAVHGDGTASRSYLYAADLMVWLWTILFKGADRVAYNVGSEHDVSIRELATTVAACAPWPTEVVVAQSPGPGSTPNRYVPSTRRAQNALGLVERVPLEDAIKRTLAFYRAVGTDCAPEEGRVRGTGPR